MLHRNGPSMQVGD